MLSPGVPLTHPAPHWTRAEGARGRRRDHRRHRAVLPRAAAPCAGRALRRDHRHQRQVDHHGADRASAARRRLRHADGRQYRHRDPVAGAAAHGARPCRGDVVLPDRPDALARSDRRHPAQYQRRTISTATARWSITPRSRSGWLRACSGGTAIVGVDDGWCRDRRRSPRSGRQARRARSRSKNPLADGVYVEHEPIVRASGGARSEVAGSAASARCAACTMRRTRPAPSACALALGVEQGRAAERLAQLPGPGAPHGAGRPARPRAVRQRLQGHQRRRGRAGAVVASAISTGSPAASRRQGGIAGLAEFFPRIRKAYLIGEAAPEFAATLGERVPHEICGTLDVAVEQRRARCGSVRLHEPVVLLSPACASFDQYRNFEIRGASSANSSRRCRREAGG